MNQYIIDTLGWMLVIALFNVMLLMLAISIWLVTPLFVTVVIAREQRHGQMLELIDKQIELEKASRIDVIPVNPLIQMIGHEPATSLARQVAAASEEVPDVPTPPT